MMRFKRPMPLPAPLLQAPLLLVLMALPCAASTSGQLSQASRALSEQATPWQLRHRYFQDQGQQLLIVATRPSLQPHDAQIAAVEGLRALFQPSQEFAEASAWPLTKQLVASLPTDTERFSQQILAALGKGQRVFVICDERHFAALAQSIEQNLPNPA